MMDTSENTLSVTAKEAFAEARKRDKALRADDSRWCTVDLKMCCGSAFHLRSAFWERYGDYVFVFTEHFGYQVNHKDEVVTVSSNDASWENDDWS